MTVRLEQNYRSFGHILKAANGVIKNNGKRMEKSLWTERGDGPKVNVYKATDTEGEAEWVVERISMIKFERNIPYEDFAVIYRANIFSRPFEEALEDGGSRDRLWAERAISNIRKSKTLRPISRSLQTPPTI